MLLFNTRRSGYNVKSFQNNYFNSTTFPDDTLPTVTNTWLTASGNKDDGAMYAGRLAQRKLIVAAMKSGIDASLPAREEQNQFNLIAAPGYPELLTNLVALSNERANTLFVVGDTPMRLSNSGTDLTTYATNNGGLGLPTDDGLTIGSAYAAVFYPSCQTTDLSGNIVVAPPTHMMVRTILRSDAVSYPWLAPAGTRRGVVDNATAIGYINAQTGEFVSLAVGQGVRDVLYENNINPITFIPGIGITNFGNKTRQGATTALDRINVARLICFLRGRLEEIGKLYLFEPNDQITRNEITNTINSLMIDLVAKRAIYDYLVVCDLSNNTPARIDRNELWVDVAIEPVKAVEFIYIPLRIKNTGEISGLNA
jgi:phage tail sheath protein FI